MPFKSNIEEVKKQVTAEYTKSVVRAVQAGFNTSNEEVPVVTGRLQASGGFAVFGPDGALIAGDSDIDSPGPTGEITGRIAYTAEYAAAVIARNTPSSGFLDMGFGDAQATLKRELV